MEGNIRFGWCSVDLDGDTSIIPAYGAFTGYSCNDRNSCKFTIPLDNMWLGSVGRINPASSFSNLFGRSTRFTVHRSKGGFESIKGTDGGFPV